MLLNNSFHCLHHLPSLWHHQPKWSGLLRFDNLTLPRLYTIVVCVLKSGSDCVYFGLPLLSHQIRIESHEQIKRRKIGHFCKFCDFKSWRCEWYTLKNSFIYQCLNKLLETLKLDLSFTTQISNSMKFEFDGLYFRVTWSR